MRHHAFPRHKTILFVAAFLLLIAPWASAAPRHGSAQPEGISGGIAIPDVLSRAWGFVSEGWMSVLDNLKIPASALQTKEGCAILPDGRCVVVSTPASSAGQGRARRPTFHMKEGCQVEPGGRCNP
jgi:hypothetical protein